MTASGRPASWPYGRPFNPTATATAAIYDLWSMNRPDSRVYGLWSMISIPENRVENKLWSMTYDSRSQNFCPPLIGTHCSLLGCAVLCSGLLLTAYNAHFGPYQARISCRLNSNLPLIEKRSANIAC